MRLDCVLADEELFGNLTIAHAHRNQREYLQLATGNTQLSKLSFIHNKRRGGRDENFLEDDDLFLSGELESKPDPQAGKQERDQAAVNLH